MATTGVKKMAAMVFFRCSAMGFFFVDLDDVCSCIFIQPKIACLVFFQT